MIFRSEHFSGDLLIIMEVSRDVFESLSSKINFLLVCDAATPTGPIAHQVKKWMTSLFAYQVMRTAPTSESATEGVRARSSRRRIWHGQQLAADEPLDFNPCSINISGVKGSILAAQLTCRQLLLPVYPHQNWQAQRSKIFTSKCVSTWL